MNDHPDTDGEGDAEAKDTALIKGLQELSNKSGRHEELPGPEPGQVALGEGKVMLTDAGARLARRPVYARQSAKSVMPSS